MQRTSETKVDDHYAKRSRKSPFCQARAHALMPKIYDQAIDFLRKRYNNKEKRNIILAKWKGMKLSRTMNDIPNVTEVNVLQQFVIGKCQSKVS